MKKHYSRRTIQRIFPPGTVITYPVNENNMMMLVIGYVQTPPKYDSHNIKRLASSWSVWVLCGAKLVEFSWVDMITWVPSDKNGHKTIRS